MTLVKAAAEILEKNPGMDPLEAVRLAREAYKRPEKKFGKRSEAELAVLRARRAWKKQRRADILASLQPVSVKIEVVPTEGAHGCQVMSFVDKESFDSAFVPADPILTYPGRVAAEVVRKARVAIRSVIK